ncbi:MAG: PGF-pre-PGF domain-containing protein [Methanosarcinaceae archaeon]|nr:PGF-pre-PGF domain-containing protein [Methanosarcinaceae archaeon]
MKASLNFRVNLRSIMILLIFAAVMFAVCIMPASAATTITVDDSGGADHTTIQAAINAASTGDTIYVYNGSYSENVTVNKQLTLQGEGADVVTVTNSTANHHVFEVTADYVNISGFNVTGATGSFKAGIYLNNNQHCNISNNNASGNYYGIYMLSSSNNTLTSNTANLNTQYGIYLYSSSNNTLTSNTDNSNNLGIYLRDSSNNTLTNNNASNNIQQGIYLKTSSNNNVLTSNTGNSNNLGIHLESSSNNTLTNNNASNNIQQGIYLFSSSNNTLTNNTDNSNNLGIYLKTSSNNALTSNTGNSNFRGIYLQTSSNNTLTNNNASNNSEHGIKLETSSNNTLTNNTGYSNTQHGIYLWYSSNNALTSNTGNSNNYGICLLSSSNNTLTNNNASNNSQQGINLQTSSNNNTLTDNTANSNFRGIQLVTTCSNNTLTNNTASSNTQYGIYLQTSSNNTIYNNYFNNTNNAYDIGYNIWNTTPTAGTNIIGGSWLGGNYWYDYAGADTNGDGLGDTLLPYNSSGNIDIGGDYHPLVVDITAPIITINSPSNGSITNDSTPELNATFGGETIAYVWYNVNNTVNSTPPISNTNNLTVTLSLLPEGTHNVTVYANDSAGNLNSSIVYFLIDTISPIATFVSPTPADNSNLSQNYIDINVTVTEDNLKNVTTYIYNGTGLVTSIVNASLPYYNNITGLADGTHYINATAYDFAGHSNFTETRTILLDTTSPTAPTNLVHIDDDAPSGYDNDNSTDISWSLSTDDASTVTYHIFRDGVLNDSITSTVFTFTNETEGSHTYNVSAIDSFGNINTTNASVTVIVDYTDPVIHNVSLSDETPAYGQLIVVTVNVIDTNLASVTAGSTSLTHQSGALWNGTITAGYGTNTVTVTAYDNASNFDTNTSVTYTGPNEPTDSSGPVNYPTPLPRNVVYNEVKGIIFNEPVASVDLKFTKGYITLMTVDAKGTISEVMVTIQKLAGKPSEIKVAPPSGAVHTYHNIDLGRIENGDLAGATIKFKAEKKWIAENGGDRNAVVVMRYHDTWMALETKPIGEDDEYVFFSARTPGFSTFAITMQLEEEIVQVEVQIPAPVIEEVVDEPLPKPEEETSYWWLILVMIVIVGVVIFVYKNKKDEAEE